MANPNESKLLNSPRRLKTPQYRRWHFQKRIQHPGPALESSWRIFRRSLGLIKRNKKLFGYILGVYVLLSLILVRGFSSTVQLSASKANLVTSHHSALGTGTTLFSNLLSSSSSTTSAGSTYQSILFLLMSLVIIWALRQVYAKQPEKAPLKAAFYQSTYPLVPFVLVLMVIGVELIPLLIGAGIYGTVVTNGLAVGGLEKLAWASMFFLLALWSLYMISASLFALYIVTLPDVRPLQALRSAKQLVQFRRWTVMRKIIFLPIFLSLSVSLIMLPTVLWLTPIAEWIFFVLSLAVLIVAHSYLYNLYRELI